MFLSFIKITLRKLYREKLYTIINISGLALGIACCLILGLFLHSELTYDQHHKNYKHIYRIVWQAGVSKIAITTAALAPMLKRENPEINDFVRFTVMTDPDSPGIAFYSGDKTFFWNKVYWADDNVFEVFTYDVIYGDPKTALVDPNSIAVSETFAKTLFGDENPIGKTVRTDLYTMKINLVFADLPENTHLKTDVLMSRNHPSNKLNPSKLRDDLWETDAGYTYLVLPENYSKASFKKIVDAFIKKYMKEESDVRNQPVDFWLQPLKDIHYSAEKLIADQQTGNAVYLYGAVVIGLLIMLVACINYMNLATARSLKRGKEVGIHKVLGSKKSQLIVQFMGESILVALIALFLGMIIVELVLTLTPVKEIVGNLQLTDYATEPLLLLGLIGATVFIGVVSGLYPALYLSSASPMAAITALKRAATAQFKMRQILVLIQFIISIGVIASTFLMVMQIRYIENKPLGFAKENRVVGTLRGADTIEKYKIIKAELLKNPNVLGMTICTFIPGQMWLPIQTGSIKDDLGNILQQKVYLTAVENDDFLDVMGMKLLEGQDFSDKIATDNNRTVIVNEALVRQMGLKEPIGKHYISMSKNTWKVIGVVKDFHFQSMHSSVAPLVLFHDDSDPSAYYSSLSANERTQESRMIVIHISGTEIPQTLDYIGNVIRKIDPKTNIKLTFYDDIIDSLYVFEKRVIGLTGLSAGICVVISCLGLFGLSAFTTEQRSKEIGVRKVVGASTMQIVLMLFKPTVVLVLIGAVIASSAAYLVMERWLAGFAYKAGINPLVFMMATLIVIIVAFVTIALQSFKTARANPVEALRYE